MTSAEAKNDLVIMVFGKTGSGVSSTVNSLLARNECPVGSGMHSTTQEIQRERRKGKKIQVIDMPDLVSMDREYKSEEKSREVLSRLTRDPLDAALLVIRSDERYTAGQFEIYLKMREKLGDLISPDNLIIVFTHGKFFQEDVVQHASGELQRVLQDAGHRYFVLDNSSSDLKKEKNACHLMTMVDRLRNPSAPKRKITLKRRIKIEIISLPWVIMTSVCRCICTVCTWILWPFRWFTRYFWTKVRWFTRYFWTKVRSYFSRFF